MGLRSIPVFVLSICLWLLGSVSSVDLMHSADESYPGMVFVQGGAFMMGTDEDENDERPIHDVSLAAFYIGRYEVTQAEWQAVMGDNPSFFKGENNPVEQIDWYMAIEFCNKKSKLEGLTPCYTGSGDNITCNFAARGYRLPTEAEWEFACSGGLLSHGYAYSGSNDVSAVAWFEGNSDGKPHPVGSKQPNEIGIYDMSGNIWEWCWDWYAGDYYKNSPSSNPSGPAAGQERSYRGGGINGRIEYMRCTGRYQLSPAYKHSDMGLRLVKKAAGKIPRGMVLVKGGKFRMGSNDGGAGFSPAHPVTLSSFYIGKFEVNQEEWVAVMGVNNSSFSGSECAVEGVRWYEAVEYCNKRSKLEGLTPCYSGSGDGIACDFAVDGYRLPTEAEWEYACRGGLASKNYVFSGSSDAEEVAWCAANVNNARTRGGGLKKPNEIGIYDMTGNAWEWCWDWYDKYYYKNSPKNDPRGPVYGTRRVVRSGSVANPALPNYFRHLMKPITGYLGYGLRVVRAAK